MRHQSSSLQLKSHRIMPAASDLNPSSRKGSPGPQGKGLWGAIQGSMETLTQAPPLRRCSRERGLPLSFAQQRLWLLQQAEPQSATYNLFFGWRLTGRLNPGAMQRAIQALVARHESFQTVFVNAGDAPAQRICGDQPFSAAAIDLRSLPEEEREAVLKRQIAAETRKPFDLGQWPLFRAFIFRIADEQHVLLLVFHHITCDGTSLTTLFRELQVFYQTFNSGCAPSLPVLPIQYADYAAWQRGWMNPQVLAPQIEYWKKQLESPLALLDLGVSQTRPPVQSSRGETYFFTFSPELTAAIREFKKTRKITLFNLLLAGYEALLYRYSGQEDLLVGVPTAGRHQSELRNIIGFFVNTLVLRTAVTGEVSFAELLRRVEETTLAAFARQDVPFEKLVEELKPTRDLSHSPLFQTMFSFQSLPRRGLELEGLEVRPLLLENGTAKFDLTLDRNETHEGIGGFLEYRGDLFARATIERMAAHLQTLFAGALANPELPLRRLPISSDAERRRLLVEWNRTDDDLAQGSVPQLIEAQARATPEALAVTGSTGQLTYGELSARSSLLAAKLCQLGVGPEVLVGISVPRSPAMVISLLAILKAGGAFVPLDPEYPRERLRFMIEDSGMPVLLTARESAPGLARPGVRLLFVEEELAALAGQPSPAPWEAKAQPRQAAYVIYTSGSTGKPKGVLMEEGPMARHCLCCQKLYGLGPQDRVLQFASLNFDTSVEQIFATLMSGSRVVLRDPAIWTPEEFAQKLSELGLTVIGVPPAYWHHLAISWAAAPESVSRHQLRLVLVGGEEMHLQSLEAWQKTPFHSVRLFNSYGPTETAVTATDFEVPPRQPGVPGLVKIPIGRPRAGRKLYVLDPWGEPTAQGVPGELHIGGGLLARGYVKRPELTAEKFVPDPFAGAPGARMYKTGDLVRYLADGNLEFLGRVDQQVKIRGFRIELGEIESVLCQHGNVREAAVAASGDVDKKLAAFFVAKTIPPPSSEELRQFLKAQLPDYMVPAACVCLERLPMTPSGKVDRKSLPIPELQAAAVEFVAPQTPAEKGLAQIWCEVLGLKRVGVNDNFFELGGHSLMAMQVISRAAAAGLGNLTLADLFDAPTIGRLAKKAGAAKKTGDRIPVLAPLGRKGRARIRIQ